MLLLLFLVYTFGTVELADNGKVYLIKNHPFLRLIKISKEMADLLAERQKRQYLVYRQDSGINSGTGLDIMTPGLETTINHPVNVLTRSLREQLDGLDSSTPQYIVMPSNSATFNPSLLNLETNTVNFNSKNTLNLNPDNVNINPSTINLNQHSINPTTEILTQFTSPINADSTSSNLVPLNLNTITSNPNGLELNPNAINLKSNVDLKNLNFATEQAIVSVRNLDIANFLATTETAITLQAFVPVDNPMDITGAIAPAKESPFVPDAPIVPSIASNIVPSGASFGSAAVPYASTPCESAMVTPSVGPIYSNSPAPQAVVPRFDVPLSLPATEKEEVSSAPLLPFVPPPVLAALAPRQSQIDSQMQPQFQPIMPAIEMMPTVESIALVAIPRCQATTGTCPGIHADVTPNVGGLISLAAYSALETATAAPQSNSQFVLPVFPMPDQGGSALSCDSCGNGIPSAVLAPVQALPSPPPPATIPNLPPPSAAPVAKMTSLRKEVPCKSSTAVTKCSTTSKNAANTNKVTTPVTVTNGSIDSMLEAIKLEIGQIKNGRFAGSREGLPCPLQGSWKSDSAGVIFNLSKSDEIEFVVPVTPWPERRGFFCSPDWEVSAFVPFPKLSFFMMTATHPSDLRMATFSGECRVCNGKEFITGHWLIVRGQKNCEDLNRAQDFFGDLWKRKCS